MSKTILITGTSSGIGRAAVKHFSEHGWNVAATLRDPSRETEMQHWQNVRLYTLDVMDEASVRGAMAAALKDFGEIDVLCNNAGYGAVGIFEKGTDAQIRKQFDTNVFGCMNTIRAILPHFRGRRNGTIINVTSMGGLITFPLYSAYHATKWAMEGFSESLAYELRPLGIRVKCIEPGAIKTEFAGRSKDLFRSDELGEYDRYEQVAIANFMQAVAKAPGPGIVGKTIFKAASDPGFRLRYVVGGQGPLLLLLRRILPNAAFFSIVRRTVEKGFSK
jgi:NAD(P)-dependent dehydrogenase (short-subunit alcohol dehydrogenase family)